MLFEGFYYHRETLHFAVPFFALFRPLELNLVTQVNRDRPARYFHLIGLAVFIIDM